MVVIRLTRVGKKNSPAYRVVVADRRRAVKRKFIEVIGHYNPILQPKEIVIDKDRALFWMEKGAIPSDTVRNLMADLGILKKSDKINKVYGREKTKKAMKESAEAKPAAETKEAEVEGDNAVAEPAEETQESENTEMPQEEKTEPESQTEVPAETAENTETNEEVKAEDTSKE
ncbi:MAG: 30S ribosomal protein S16 [Patescibacteria group bacterium]